MTRLLPVRLLAALALPFALTACNGGGGGGGSDTDAGDLSEFEGLYEVSFWSDDPLCGGGPTDFPPAFIRLTADGNTWTQAPCASEDNCDIVRDQWTTTVDGSGPDASKLVDDAAYNASADSCQVFEETASLTFAGSKATFNREVLTAAYQANGTSDEACRELLEQWDRTGDKADCISWEGTLVSGGDE